MMNRSYLTCTIAKRTASTRLLTTPKLTTLAALCGTAQPTASVQSSKLRIVEPPDYPRAGGG